MRKDTTTRRRSRHARRNRGPLGKRDSKLEILLARRPAHWEATTMDVIGGPVEITAAADTAGAAEDVKRFSMLAYAGGLVKPMNSPGKTVFDLAGMDTAGQRPALLHHRMEQLVGHTEAIENTGREIKAAGVISGGTEYSKHVIETAGRGFAWRVSVGIDPENAEIVPAGQSKNINGRRLKGPFYHITKSTLKEISFVTVAADDSTQAIVASQNLKKEKGTMNFNDWLEANEFDADNLTEKQTETLNAQYEAETGVDTTTTAEPIAASIQLHRDQMAEECSRIDTIERLCAGHPGVQGKAIAEGWDSTRTELELLRAERSSGPAIHSRSHESEATLDTLQGAMLLRSGFQLDDPLWSTTKASGLAPRWLRLGIDNDQRQRVMDLAHQFRDVSMIDICREAARLDGTRLPMGRADMIKASTSGASLSNIFSTNVNLSLLKSYEETRDSTAGWVGETDVANFLTQERARLKPGSGLARLARGGESRDVTRSDTVETYRISRFSGSFHIDEQDIIDDHQNALNSQPAELGAAAARIRPQLVYSILLSNPNMADGTPIFDATRGNRRTSATFAAATLANAIGDFRTQTEDGVTLNILPSHLIVPAALNLSAAQLINSSETRVPAASAETGTRNVFADQGLTLVTSPWLDNGMTDPASEAAVTGAAGDWYLMDSASPAIEVAYLRSSGRAPSIRTEAMPVGRYGVSWAVSLDIGAKAVRALSAHKSEA